MFRVHELTLVRHCLGLQALLQQEAYGTGIMPAPQFKNVPIWHRVLKAYKEHARATRGNKGWPIA
eukprot:1145264-Pelagomonas_calceolata.AAC.6